MLLFEDTKAAITVFVTGRLQFAQYKRVAANRALTVNYQATGQYVCTFDSYADGYQLVCSSEMVMRPHTDTMTAMDIHAVIHYLAHAFHQL